MLYLRTFWKFVILDSVARCSPPVDLGEVNEKRKKMTQES